MFSFITEVAEVGVPFTLSNWIVNLVFNGDQLLADYILGRLISAAGQYRV